MGDGVAGALRALADAVNNVCAAFAAAELPDTGDLIALSGLGVALASVALQSSLHVELQRAELAVSHPGRENSTAISRVAQLTTTFLLAGGLNMFAAAIAAWPWGDGTRLMWATGFAFSGYGLFALSYFAYLLNIHLFDPLAKEEAGDALG